MNKDFWERVNRLQGLAETIPVAEWYHLTVGKDHHAVFSKNKPEAVIALTCLDEDGTRVGLGEKTSDYIAAANPAMILEMIAVMRKLEDENSKLKTVSDFVAKKGLQLAKQLAEFCNPDHDDQCCSLYSENCNNANFIEWREAAHDAVKDGE